MHVRLALQRDAEIGLVSAQLQLGEEGKFYPSDAALASWMAQFGTINAQIIYE